MHTSSPAPLGVSRKAAKEYSHRVERVLELREQFKSLTDQEIKDRAGKIRSSLTDQVSAKTRVDLQVEVFALASEASSRILGQTPYPVQILGGLVIADGSIAEMATGEGKTLTAVAPVAWWALFGKGVHVATANDYLAERDSSELAPVYQALGLSVAFTNRQGPLMERQAAYAADITYATAQTLGFDYLTDNLAHQIPERVGRNFFAAIVDEADSLLIDEARTPLIISAPNARLKANWGKYAEFVQTLTEDQDYEFDKGEEFVTLTESGADAAEAFFELKRLYDHPVEVQRILTALRAKELLLINRDYIVVKDEVVIVDANTGRTMPGRRFQDGMHEALEAKEKVSPQAPSVTMASTTLQSFFGMYSHLGGMTGTALTDAEELTATYGTQVLGIPTHRPLIRKDLPDLLFANADTKFSALASEIEIRRAKGQPVLVGTSGVEESENISERLNVLGIEHEVLNARSHERESKIIADAGRKGAVTVSTNMAGRGVDIKLGGHESSKEDKSEILELGGLAVFSTSRAHSRRIDNQLRGRSGRQGEPGETQFFLAADDELVSTFGGPQVSNLISALSSSSSGPLAHPALSKALDRSQRRVEGIHSDARRSLVEFDGVYTAQRKAFYELRRNILESDFEDQIYDFFFKGYQSSLLRISKKTKLSKMSSEDLSKALRSIFPLALPENFKEAKTPLELASMLALAMEENVSSRLSPLGGGLEGDKLKKNILSRILLDMIDQGWTRHLTLMENLEGSVALRRYAQVDPKIAFAQEAKILYQDFLDRFLSVAAINLTRLNLQVTQKETSAVTEKADVKLPEIEKSTTPTPLLKTKDSE